MPTEAKTYSSPDVEHRVRNVLEEVQQVIFQKPWEYPTSDRTINRHIPTLAGLSSRLKQTLNDTPWRAEVEHQIHRGFIYPEGTRILIVKQKPVSNQKLLKSDIIQTTSWPELQKKALRPETLYQSLMNQANSVARLFAGYFHSGPAEVSPEMLTFAQMGAEQRRADWDIATKKALELLERSRLAKMPPQFNNIIVNAARWETVSHTPGFRWERDANWNRMLLGFYLKGMFDVEFQRFEPLAEKGGSITGLRAHFLRKNGGIGCWAEWENSVRAYHEPDESCSTYNSYASRLRDKLSLSLRPYPNGDDFNHRPIDRTK